MNFSDRSGLHLRQAVHAPPGPRSALDAFESQCGSSKEGMTDPKNSGTMAVTRAAGAMACGFGVSGGFGSWSLKSG
jgi:hypothetical protein